MRLGDLWTPPAGTSNTVEVYALPGTSRSRPSSPNGGRAKRAREDDLNCSAVAGPSRPRAPSQERRDKRKEMSSNRSADHRSAATSVAPVHSALPPQPPYSQVPPATPAQRPAVHPYLSGNYAPVERECRALTPCAVVQGRVPRELAGGQYVRNGGNPAPAHMDNDRASHWFDGDGMLAGVLFQPRRTDGGAVTAADEDDIEPLFVNRYIVTDVHRITPDSVRTPLIPSIATLVSPSFSYIALLGAVLRTFLFYALTWLPFLGYESAGAGSQGDDDGRAKRLSVANATVWWHDGRALAGCESGPPMQVKLPTLETVDWYTGTDRAPKGWAGGWGGLHSHFMEYTTAHPKLDPRTGEMMLYHMSLVRPYLRVSVIPSSSRVPEKRQAPSPTLLGARVPGLSTPKLMHDFACTSTRTLIIDHPLALDPANLLRGRNILDYDARRRTRFALFPRHEPERAAWVEAEDSFVVFHTANAWDEGDDALALLACRMNSATLVYTAGNMQPPRNALPPAGEREKCQLYYWSFATAGAAEPRIECEFALSDVPCEFPTLDPQRLMSAARFVYGTSTRNGSFDASLKLAAKIDCLVKVNVQSLIAKGRKMCADGLLRRTESVDTRTVEKILQQQAARGAADDDVSIFAMPQGWYAQEASFVPRANAQSEDDGYLLFYAFDESTGLDPLTGTVWPNAKSELWILDARTMQDVVARIRLPQRVPYGLHGNFFSPQQIAQQNLPSSEHLRSARFDRHRFQASAIDPISGKAPHRGLLSRAAWAFKGFVEAQIA